ncbi:hypothetical protein AAMO2058_001577400 [Amorphochlora amoebiformis]
MQARASNIRARIQSLPLGSAFRLAWLTTPILCASPVYHSSGSIAGPHRESYSYAIPRRGLVRRATDFGEGGSVRRAYLWSHHIYAKKKKREIPELAKKLGLTGFCSTGKPGFIVVEGDEANVKRFLSTVKRWPWQRSISLSIQSISPDKTDLSYNLALSHLALALAFSLSLTSLALSLSSLSLSLSHNLGLT